MPDANLNGAHADDPSSDSLESLIRAAGDYVHPSADLRPRTLETARHRRRQQRRAGGLAIAALILAVLLPSGSGQHSHPTLFGNLSIPAISQALSKKSPGNGVALNTLQAGLGADWALVDIFTQLRRQQAALLHGDHSTR